MKMRIKQIKSANNFIYFFLFYFSLSAEMKDHYWEAAEQLRGENGYPYEMMHFHYAIIKSVRGNIAEANKLIQEGTKLRDKYINPDNPDTLNCDSDSRSSENNDKGNFISRLIKRAKAHHRIILYFHRIGAKKTHKIISPTIWW